jgi:Ca2+-binding RTX toxin-like protein
MGVWEPGPGPTAGDDLFIGDAANETVDGLAGNDTLEGGQGDDTLEGGPGNDVIDGGVGRDTASYATAPAGVSVNLFAVGRQDTGGGGADVLVSIENLIGSMFDDNLTGFNDSVLRGGEGDDTLIIGGLFATLDGGAALRLSASRA